MRNQEIHDAAPDPRVLGPCQAELLRRVSREMDRFLVMLTQVEWHVAVLIDNHNGVLPDGATDSLQHIDYVSQVSSSLSMLLSRMAEEPEADIDALLTAVLPKDLRDRLYDRLLGDIDNFTQKIEIF